jgi:protein TonB
MHLTLLESDRSFLRSAECAAVSIVAHAGLVWLAIASTAGGRQLPADEREARVFFLLPPDRVKAPDHQTDVIQWARVGTDLANGPAQPPGPGQGLGVREPAYGSNRGRGHGARGDLPFGPPSRLLSDTAFSVLEVDQMVERYEGSAAPDYPEELRARGVEGQVEATYVVDTTGRVDTATIRVLRSDHPRFTESVRAALGGMRFRPAKRAGRPVRQLVAQRFRFLVAPVPQMANQPS